MPIDDQMAAKLDAGALTGTCGRPRSSIRATDPQIPAVSAQPGSDSLLDGSLGKTTPIGDRTGTKPCGSTPTIMRDVRCTWGIRPGHGSRDVHAFGPARFICFSEGLLGQKMQIDDRMGSKPDTWSLTCTARLNRTEKSVGVTDPEIPTLLAQPDLVLY